MRRRGFWLCAPLPAALLLALAGCRPASPPPAPAPDVPMVVREYGQYAAGDSLDRVQSELKLNDHEVRYRASMPEGQMGMVYFLDQGNLHIDAKKSGDRWVILSPPILELSDLPAAGRVAEWDRGADRQNLPSKSER